NAAEERDPAASGGGGQPNPQEGGPPAKPANSNQMNVGQNADMEHRTFEQVPSVGGNRGQQQQGRGQSNPPPSPGGNNPGGGNPGGGNSGGPPPPPSPNKGGGGGGPGGGNPGGGGQNWQQGQPGQGRQPGGPGGGQQPAQQPGRQSLYLLFNNNRYPIESDRFVIGRGSQNTDLTIRDGNISRQHCAIIFRNSNWYLKDLDSTNGVEYRGNRIESKRIEEGDVFYLCDYPLQFTYR
ncbi:MAG: FHA domain-containing protein, partial [Bradymonadaceae bacterium]